MTHEPANATVRHLLQRAAWERGRGRHEVAHALLLEAGALEAAIRQYERAIVEARGQVDDLRQAVARFWDEMADDRTLHDLADDAGVLLTLFDDLDRAQSRLLTLEMTRP